ncbi:MAG: 3-hydroxyacyl-CoA dehydrogenase NAD-binding domain-containing protein [Sphingomonadales bacterium]|nr:3-hydroxyacyl-CoA dehydrogenase NAD-binding domain-containing protein [Sphingomonadales bacterium]
MRKPVDKVACIGAGTVGAAWAVAFARAGHAVALFDSSSEQIHKHALPHAHRTLDLLSRAGFLEEGTGRVLARIDVAGSIADAVAEADYVQESVREDVAIKRDVFSEIAAHARPDTVLASSTSAIRGSEFLGHISHPERALVAHPVNPPSLIPLVEICATNRTHADVVSRTKDFLTEIGMTPVVVRKEIDGFLLNRLQYTLVAEALHLVGEGYCSAEDIDLIITDGLAPRWASIGPFAVAHLNSSGGFLGFVDQLGPMMKRIGQDARTDYPWDMDLARTIHAALAERIPVSDIPEHQDRRDAQILAARKIRRPAKLQQR